MTVFEPLSLAKLINKGAKMIDANREKSSPRPNATRRDSEVLHAQSKYADVKQEDVIAEGDEEEMKE